MSDDSFVKQAVAGWRRNNQITLDLLDQIPEGGLPVVPLKSRGRSVGRQLLHVDAVRRGWVHYHATGKRPERDAPRSKTEPTRGELAHLLKESGEEVAELLGRALTGEAKVRLFGRDPVRWLLYLLAHESHHRGQIALALKQAGMRLSQKAALQGLWGKWIFGREP